MRRYLFPLLRLSQGPAQPGLASVRRNLVVSWTSRPFGRLPMVGGSGWGPASVSAASSRYPLGVTVASAGEAAGAWCEAAGVRGALPLWGMAGSPALKQGERYQNHTCSCYLPHRLLQLQLPGSPLANIFKSFWMEKLDYSFRSILLFHFTLLLLFYSTCSYGFAANN